MIYESGPWKAELRRAADMLARWSQKHATPRGYFILERNTFLSAFVLRKLCDSHKVTDQLRLRPTAARFFPALPRVRTSVSAAMGKSFIDEVYDLDGGEVRVLHMREIANLIIHSFFFRVQPNERDEVCLFFNSDRTKEDYVVELPVPRYVGLLKNTVEDHVKRYSITFADPTKQPVIELS